MQTNKGAQLSIAMGFTPIADIGQNNRSTINLIVVETPQRAYSPWLVLSPTTMRKASEELERKAGTSFNRGTASAFQNSNVLPTIHLRDSANSHF